MRIQYMSDTADYVKWDRITNRRMMTVWHWQTMEVEWADWALAAILHWRPGLTFTCVSDHIIMLFVQFITSKIL